MDRSSPSPLFLAVRFRRILARTVTRRAIVVLAAVVTAVAVTIVLRSAEHTRSRWGDTRRVAVAQHDLGPGDVVDAGAVSVLDVPRAAVAGAATDVVPLGAVVRYPIAAGEPVVGTRLAPEGLTGVAALVPEGQRAVAIAVGPAGVPPVHPGDRVDVVALTPAPSETQEAEAETEASPDPATTLVDHAVVVDVSDTAVTIAVPLALAPAVAYGAAQGLVVLTLVGG
ncbi:MAG TPA: SAF domain-containing protein [Acidimicrobiales bacterium]|nr:SAF domain-containing protein [Acidimicrobiales bacterium]